MKTFLTKLFSQLLSWSVVALCAAGMIYTFFGGDFGLFARTTKTAPRAPEEPVYPVSTTDLQLSDEEFSVTYAGMLRPFERYPLSFEVAGRIVAFNAADGEKQLDQGDNVQPGQVVARLDDTLMVVARTEASAQLELAQANLKRLQDLRGKNRDIVTSREYEDALTDVRLAQARLDRAEKNWRDTRLVSPAHAVIAQRMGNPGVSVAPHTPVLELLEVDRLLLVVGVPEARIHDLRLDQPVRVQLIGHDFYGNPWPPQMGKIYRLDEAADQQTGLFEVEVLLPNDQVPNAQASRDQAAHEETPPLGAGTKTAPEKSAPEKPAPEKPASEKTGGISEAPLHLRPGLIARATIVLQKRPAYRLPVDAFVQRERQLGVFVVDDEDRARFVFLPQFVEQGAHALLTTWPAESRRLILRGQHRLVEGVRVNVTETEPQTSPQ